MIKVGIVDNHKLIRESFAILINTFNRIEVVLQAANGIELLDQLPNCSIDVLLLDLQMPKMTGFETCKWVRSQYPNIKILVVSELNSIEIIHKIIQLGAHGYFTKNSHPKELERAILNVSDNNIQFGQELSNVLKEILLWDKNNNIKALDSPIHFSKRELDVARLVCKELSSKAIAEQLCISTNTVETHRQKILKKTTSNNFTGSIIYMLKNGFLKIEDL